MIKRLLWRWVYKRITKAGASDVDHIKIIKRLLLLARTVSLNNAGYRALIKYALFTKTRNMKEFHYALTRINRLIEVRSFEVDQFDIRYQPRTRTRLSMWLTDDNGIAYTEKEVFHRTLNLGFEFIRLMESVQQTDPSRYTYYKNALEFITNDMIDVIDAFIAITLGVTDGTRHAQHLVPRR